ncbi:hypothetical protein [Methanobrevibacter sp.]|uniref:hypothetical protein n=1 Tax=Methanobrevibacter sp. TaxID=66852 RepID=UPI00386D5219
MKEKQFIITDDGQFRDTVFGYVFDKKSACDLLNEAYEWAGQDSELIKTLRKRVFELKNQIGSQAGVIEGYQKRNESLSKELIMIKTVIKESFLTERTDMGKSVLRQLCDNLEIEV